MRKIKDALGGFLSNITIGKRLLLFNVLVVLLPTALILFLFYGRFSGILQESLLDAQIVTSLQAAKFVDSMAGSLASVGDVISGDEKLPRLLGLTDDTVPARTTGDDAFNSDMEQLRAVVESHVDGAAISAIRIYADLPPALAAAGGDVFADRSEVSNTYWYGIFTSQNTERLFAPEYYLSRRERTGFGSLAIIQRRIIQYDGVGTPVYVAVYTPSDVLVDLLQNIELESVEGISSYIINSRDTVVAQTDEAAYGMYAMSYEALAESIPSESQFIQKDVAGVNVFISYRDISGTDWRMVWVVPRDSIVARSGQVIFQFIVIYLLMAAAIFAVGVAMSRTIVGRINSLRNQMQQIKTERPKPLTLPPGKDEIGELIETYNYMVKRIDALLDDTLDKAEELNNVKITALRAQIDPHFLYNTLDMINWLSRAGSNERVSETVMALSRFYRLTLNRGNLTASVAAELEHVSLYVQLMNMRFDDKIEYLVDMPEDMLDYEIPLIIFQPIVENAIQHGIFEKPSKRGKILITGWSDADTLYFLIGDDGIGMTAEQISKLLLSKTEEGDGNGIGVYNTHRRLQLMYHSDDCGLHYSSEYGKGTDVTFRIPKHLEKRGGARDANEPPQG